MVAEASPLVVRRGKTKIDVSELVELPAGAVELSDTVGRYAELVTEVDDCPSVVELLVEVTVAAVDPSWLITDERPTSNPVPVEVAVGAARSLLDGLAEGWTMLAGRPPVEELSELAGTLDAVGEGSVLETGALPLAAVP